LFTTIWEVLGGIIIIIEKLVLCGERVVHVSSIDRFNFGPHFHFFPHQVEQARIGQGIGHREASVLCNQVSMVGEA